MYIPSPAISFVGRHNSGKTTLIERVIAVENAAAYFYVAIAAVLVRICYYRDAARFVERMRSGF